MRGPGARTRGSRRTRGAGPRRTGPRRSRTGSPGGCPRGGPSIPSGTASRERAKSRRLKSFIPTRRFRVPMAGVRDFREVFAYNWRVLRDFCDALAKLPTDAVAKDRDATHGSMKNIFHHILSVHDGWLNVTAQGASADPVMREKDFDEVRSMEPLRGYLEKIIAKEKRFLAKLTDKDLDRGVQPEWKTRPHPLREALLQVTFEQAHHTGELIALLWQIDVEPPEMTWIDVRLLNKGDPGPS